MDGALQVLLDLMKADERVLADPEPYVYVASLGASSVDLTMMCWADSANYWAMRCDLTKNVKLAIEAAGYSIPFPQQDVHIIPSSSADTIPGHGKKNTDT